MQHIYPNKACGDSTRTRMDVPTDIILSRVTLF